MTLRGSVWIGAAAFWMLFGLLSGIQVWISVLTHGHSLPRLVGYYVVLWAPWLAFSALVDWLSRRWPLSHLRRASIAIHMAAALVPAWRTARFGSRSRSGSSRSTA